MGKEITERERQETFCVGGREVKNSWYERGSKVARDGEARVGERDKECEWEGNESEGGGEARGRERD